MSEFGLQAFPFLATVKSYAEEADLDLDSTVMLDHQRHPEGNAVILRYLGDDYGAPQDFATALYLSQVQQADAVGFAIECHRRASHCCMGSVYWQLNDCLSKRHLRQASKP